MTVAPPIATAVTTDAVVSIEWTSQHGSAMDRMEQQGDSASTAESPTIKMPTTINATVAIIIGLLLLRRRRSSLARSRLLAKVQSALARLASAVEPLAAVLAALITHTCMMPGPISRMEWLENCTKERIRIFD